MGNKCSVCAHPDVGTINARLICPGTDGGSLRDAAGQFGLSKSSLARHRDKCIRGAMAKAAEAHETEVVARGDSLLDEIRQLKDRGMKLLDDAESAGDRRTATSALREVKGVLELLCRATGQLQPAGANVQVVNVGVNVANGTPAASPDELPSREEQANELDIGDDLLADIAGDDFAEARALGWVARRRARKVPALPAVTEVLPP
jgi:hypothetical protein